ncbi:MAG: class D beta-lactamase [Bacteroidetes bacterium]|nr:MAG: class D beta-lactamase [Bacteroidota bacterium]
MKVLYIASILVFLCSCQGKKDSSISPIKQEIDKEIQVPEFQTMIDSSHVRGAVLIYDLGDHKYYSNDYQWARKGHLPASTFKIANSIIALETGVAESDSSLFKWNGEKRRLKTWEQDLILKEAFHFSCVPCYQEIARKIGVKKMNQHLSKFDYGNMVVDSGNIDLFWLEGASRISQLQQIDFLKRLYQSELPISDRTEMIMKRMMIIENNDSLRISGKTGWSIQNDIHNGWFVGCLEIKDKAYFFATNIESTKQSDLDRFADLRKNLTMRALKQLKFLN